FNASARNSTTALTYADNDDHGITLKYTQKISAELKANMQLHYDRKSFDDVTYTGSPDKREDDLVVIKGEGNYKLNDTSFVNMALKYVNNDTNYLPLDYERADVLMTYNILF
ncbi:MAG: hypothetical protein R3302_01265, partial [Sulfurimonadaceae bacterium]|nr:hypothetical protein [Sulfurimonadaceae bacterium]